MKELAPSSHHQFPVFSPLRTGKVGPEGLGRPTSPQVDYLVNLQKSRLRKAQTAPMVGQVSPPAGDSSFPKRVAVGRLICPTLVRVVLACPQPFWGLLPRCAASSRQSQHGAPLVWS